MAKTNGEILADKLLRLNQMNEAEQRDTVDYIECPPTKCPGDEDITDCRDCKINWLLAEYNEEEIVEKKKRR